MSEINLIDAVELELGSNIAENIYDKALLATGEDMPYIVAYGFDLCMRFCSSYEAYATIEEARRAFDSALTRKEGDA